MSLSPWDAVTHVHSFRADATKTGELADPAGQPLDGVLPIRDEIEARVRRLLDDLDVTTN